ncbi:MAG: hypothetical protein IKS82_08460 [Bacteroidales bacterium]|nr:hypothetical protein [Bacteroidales bacterium]
MKDIADINFITVGKLVAELKEYGKDYLNYVLNIEIPDGSVLNVMSTGLDRDGDLSIEVDEDPDEGYYDIQMLIDDLEGYDKNARVYMEGCGLLFTFNVQADGSILSEPNDEDETVGCDALAFGEYKYEPSGWLTESQKRELAEEARKEKRKEKIYTIVLAVLIVAEIVGLVYHVKALLSHTQPLWESILWIVVYIVLLVICGGTLYYSVVKKHKS